MISQDRKKLYDKERYFNVVRPKIFGDRRCKACNIKMAGRYGADNTRTYCRMCVETGDAKRHMNVQYYKRHRKEILQRIKQAKVCV